MQTAECKSIKELDENVIPLVEEWWTHNSIKTQREWLLKDHENQPEEGTLYMLMDFADRQV